MTTIQDLKLTNQYPDAIESVQLVLDAYNRIIEKKGSFEGLSNRLQSLEKCVNYMKENEVDCRKVGEACDLASRNFDKFLTIVK